MMDDSRRSPDDSPANRRKRRGRRATVFQWTAVVLLALTAGAWIGYPPEFSNKRHTIHVERSPHGRVFVKQVENIRCLTFGPREDGAVLLQSCVELDNPGHIHAAYTKMMISALALLETEATRGLVIGLGGGVVPTAMRRLAPNMDIDTVDVNPAVVKIAQSHFGFVVDEKTRAHVQDGRVFVKRAVAKGRRYDIVMVDAFNADYIPEHMTTVEFARELRQLIEPDGLLVINTFSNSQLYDRQSTTYTAAFGRFHNFLMPEKNTRIVLATASERPLITRAVRENVERMTAPMAEIGIPLADYLPMMSGVADWDVTARILTDQNAPANLLANFGRGS